MGVLKRGTSFYTDYLQVVFSDWGVHIQQEVYNSHSSARVSLNKQLARELALEILTWFKEDGDGS